MYVHLPFCGYRCHYCACKVTVATRTDVVDRYLDHVERETRARHRDLRVAAAGRSSAPGRRNAELSRRSRQLERLVEMLEHRSPFEPAAERSLEADPRLATREGLVGLSALAFQRISYGVQDFDPAVQAAIGRPQSEAVVRRRWSSLGTAGFAGINIDLIYGLPVQTAPGFAHTLEAALALTPDRMACYSYAHATEARHNQRLIDARVSFRHGRRNSISSRWRWRHVYRQRVRVDRDGPLRPCGGRSRGGRPRAAAASRLHGLYHASGAAPPGVRHERHRGRGRPLRAECAEDRRLPARRSTRGHCRWNAATG